MRHRTPEIITDQVIETFRYVFDAYPRPGAPHRRAGTYRPLPDRPLRAALEAIVPFIEQNIQARYKEELEWLEAAPPAPKEPPAPAPHLNFSIGNHRSQWRP